jgi:hypothetical protein
VIARAAALALGALGACSRAPLTSCDDDLRGVYTDGDQRWMLLDDGATLTAYPLFPDGAPPPGPPDAIAAPRTIALTRSPARAPRVLAGTLRRRYMQRADRCDAELAVHITRCSGDELELVLADPSPPLAFAPCRWPRPAPARVARWRRD